MQTEQIVALLIAERDRLSRGIEALQGPAKQHGRAPAGTRVETGTATSRAPSEKSGPKYKLRAAGRKAIAEAARRRWAAIKAGKATSPFPKRSKKR